MDLNDLTQNQPIVEAQLVWARKGNSVSRKFRCSIGHRAGRLVSSMAQCGAPIDVKKQLVLKKTKAAKGRKMAIKAQRTKKMNPASKAVQILNKAKIK